VAYRIWVQDGSLSLGHDGCLHFVGITNSGSFTVFKGALASRHPVGRWGSAESPDGTGGDWERSGGSVARFEPSVLFLWFDDRGFRVGSQSLFGNLGLSEVRRIAVSHLQRFGSRLLLQRVRSHFESLSL
jgi:hypothetical protein